jgi:uncharacterized protein
MDSVVHFEIPADDAARARKFYKAAFGWQIQEMPEMNYAVVRTTAVGKDFMPTEPGAINGGIMEKNPMLKTPIITIAVADIDKAAKKIEKEGGKLMVPKQKVGDMGFSAYFQDTEGNILGLWQLAR